MPPLNSVIRRYTPPTCTLEILAQTSPLSRLMGKTVIKQLSFELCFDDLSLAEQEKIYIRGDRDQLEILSDVVTTYVQKFLQQSADCFWLSRSQPQDSSKVSHESDFRDFQQSSLPQPHNAPSLIPSPEGIIRLEPGTYLTHNLFLGPLTNHTSGPVLQLSLLQLFDLATALDEYSADVMALPNLQDKTLTLTLPKWAPIAAVMVLGLGLAPMTWQYAHNSREATNDNDVKVSPSAELTTLPTPSPKLTLPPFVNVKSPVATVIPSPTSSPPEVKTTANSEIAISPQGNLPSSVPAKKITPPVTPLVVNKLQPRGISTAESSINPKSLEVSANPTLVDKPQIAEVREVLSQRWQPPNGFPQTLEYSVMVNSDGTLERIWPLNPAAREHIEISGIPRIGEQFVPGQYQENVRIRVRLTPDGKVQTFYDED